MVLKSSKSVDDSCNIHTKVTKFNFVCSIENFSQRSEKTGQKISSSTCVIENKERSEWCLNIYPKGLNEDSKEYVSVFVSLLKPDKAKAKFKLSILNDMREKINVCFVKDVTEIDSRG